MWLWALPSGVSVAGCHSGWTGSFCRFQERTFEKPRARTYLTWLNCSHPSFGQFGKLDLGSNGTLELQFNFAEHCTPVGLLWRRFSWILGQRRICRGTAEFIFRQIWWLEVLALNSPLNPLQLRSFKLLISKSWRLPCATRCFKTLGWDFVMRTSNFAGKAVSVLMKNSKTRSFCWFLMRLVSFRLCKSHLFNVAGSMSKQTYVLFFFSLSLYVSLFGLNKCRHILLVKQFPEVSAVQMQAWRLVVLVTAVVWHDFAAGVHARSFWLVVPLLRVQAWIWKKICWLSILPCKCTIYEYIETTSFISFEYFMYFESILSVYTYYITVYHIVYTYQEMTIRIYTYV